jgi:hypothetical protein
MRVMRYAATTVVVLLAGGAAAFAQPANTPQQPLQNILGFLITNQGVQTSDFDKDRAAAEATRETMTRALLSSLATAPVSPSSSGFSYRLNPALGTVERASATFGTFYVERALTSGAGQASIGFTLQYESFQAFDGQDLRNGGFVTTSNQFVDEAQPFDVESIALSLTTRTATVFGNIGISDRVDIGASVPLVQLKLNGTRVNTYRGQSSVLARATAERVGFADIAVRTKVRLTGEGPGAVAAAVEARLPTGREEDLLGAGELALRFQGLGSYEAGAASFHGNATIGTGGIGREIAWGGAVAVAASPRVTLVGELQARRLSGMPRIEAVSARHPRISNVLTTRLMPSGEDSTTAFTVAGIKWNVGSTWLLHAHVLMPLTDNGLTPTFTPTLALDYSFAR